MLRITAPYMTAWNAWYTTYDNRPEGVAAQHALVDAACRDVGRDPAEVARTVAAFVSLPGATGLRSFDRFYAPAIDGSPDEIAQVLRGLAEAGVDHVQLVIDPCTPAGVASLVPILASLDA